MFNRDKKETTKEAPLSATDLRNIIGKGTIIEGNIETVGNIRIDGKLKGNIKAQAKVALGEGSIVEGDIQAQNAEIEGKVVGVLRIQDVLILKPTAVITGDIYTTKMIVEAGAIFNGSCKMGENIHQASANGNHHNNGTSEKSAKQTAEVKS